MLYVSRKVGNEENYGVVDTDDGVEEIYSKDYLLSVGERLKIRGVDMHTGSIKSCAEKFIEKQIERFRVAGAFPMNAEYDITDTHEGVYGNVLSGLKIGLELIDAVGDIEKLRIPEGVAWFDTGLGFKLYGLKEVVLPRSMEVLYDECFENCTQLSKVNIPKNLKVLKDGCFSNTGFEHLDLSKTHIEEIEGGCFQGCKRLKSIVLPKTLNYDNIDVPEQIIGFVGCSNLEQVVFNSRIEELPDDIFNGCDKLRILYLPFGVEVISSQMLVKLKSLTDVYCRGNTDIADMLLSEIGSLGAGNRIRIHI